MVFPNFHNASLIQSIDNIHHLHKAASLAHIFHNLDTLYQYQSAHTLQKRRLQGTPEGGVLSSYILIRGKREKGIEHLIAG